MYPRLMILARRKRNDYMVIFSFTLIFILKLC